MLTGLRIQNFKGLEGPIEVPIKPVTLLFGVNSAGKSSVLHSLHFMRSVLDQYDLDPSGSPFAADDIDLGGFFNLLHKHMPGRRMVLGYSLDLSATDLPEYGATTAFSVSDEVHSAYVEFGFSADEQDRLPRLDYYLVGLNGQDVALVMPDEVRTSDGRARTAFIDVRHPLLASSAQSIEDADVELLPAPPLVLRKLIPISQAEAAARPTPNDPEQEDQRKVSEFEEYKLHRAHRDLLSYQLKGFRSGLPPWGKLVSQVIEGNAWDEEEEEEEDDDVNVISPQILTELTVGPLEVLRNILGSTRAVGPLRSIPPRRLALDSHAKESDWYGGLAAWQRLYECSDVQLQEVSDWLINAERLGTGYGLTRIVAREVPENLLLAALVDLTETGLASSFAGLNKLPVIKRVLLVDTLNSVQVTPHDVGVGLSQLIPVVVAALDRASELLLIEQPELHIHPRVQVGLGDLFLEASREYRRSFLIETHSEAMLLRMMKRIRQTQDSALPPGGAPATVDDVAVCLLQNEGQGVTVTQMQMNRRGEFIKPWPRGLFEESLRETF